MSKNERHSLCVRLSVCELIVRLYSFVMLLNARNHSTSFHCVIAIFLLSVFGGCCLFFRHLRNFGLVAFPLFLRTLSITYSYCCSFIKIRICCYISTDNIINSPTKRKMLKLTRRKERQRNCLRRKWVNGQKSKSDKKKNIRFDQDKERDGKKCEYREILS